ncbi:hypothetical protein OPT61_g1062 [Boeremia exigua]|uniref:Uncharacterized protein n=1 Tax=Boeremia exigua TaxID=749465 RepID=A0ACC2IRQ6_9PLEO|nr:hypothetical protein OPT61_g1062 [Boeremia exigua]
MWILDFASKVGFFVSYVLTFFLVLEVVRLVCTDANKREAEKLLDAYARGREQEKEHEKSCRLPVKELEHELENYSGLRTQTQQPQTPQRHTRRAVLDHTPFAERRPISEEKEKRKRSQTPTRLRKRSDTLNSTNSSDSRHSSQSKNSSGTSESRRSSRSYRDSSPESISSKSSSRHASPGFRRIKDAQGASLSLHRLLKQKA